MGVSKNGPRQDQAKMDPDKIEQNWTQTIITQIHCYLQTDRKHLSNRGKGTDRHIRNL